MDVVCLLMWGLLILFSTSRVTVAVKTIGAALMLTARKKQLDRYSHR